MYINDVNIIWYTAMALLGIVVAQFIDYCNNVFFKILENTHIQ